jgi:hypothetical protein
MALKYTKWQYNIPFGHAIFQHFHIQGPPKYFQIGIFVLRIHHLATLARSVSNEYLFTQFAIIVA